jgi:RimJ/RimL family protein N-acetyltransferase
MRETLNTPATPWLTDGVVVVNALTQADTEAHWAGEDEEHARRFRWYPKRSSINGVRAFLDQTARHWREGGPRRTLAIRQARTGTLVGGCELRLQSDGSAHLSWWTFPTFRRRGYATRGVRLLIQYAADVMAVRRFVALIAPDNDASLGVARSAGLTEIGLEPGADPPMSRFALALDEA